MKKNIAIILAAGQGKRMEATINKQFLCINKKPILCHTIEVFSKSKEVDEIILVCASEEIEYCQKEIVDKYGYDKVVLVVEGGKERQNSVFNGLKAVNNCNIVLIHDGARPFVTEEIIKKGIEFAKLYGACACGVKAKDTIKIKSEEGFAKDTLKRDEVFLIQTPQCFKYDLIYSCHEKLNETNIQVTDDTMVVEMFNNHVYLYDGSYSNIKLTTPEDLIIAEAITNNYKN